jgi:hypothetical protein
MQGERTVRKLVIATMLMGISLPVFAARRVSVEQIEQVLASAHGWKDAKLARQLTELEATERISTSRLARWKAVIPEGKARLALVALADQSAFLDLPAAEIPDLATPDQDAQRQILAKASEYVKRTVPQLPNFMATRETTRYESADEEQTRSQGFAPGMGMPVAQVGSRATSKESASFDAGSLRQVSRSSITVFYRDGHEQEDVGSKKKRDKDADHEFRTVGEFGPILATILVDMAKGSWSWSHWEQGKEAKEAVFAYTVPQPASHFMVRSTIEAARTEPPSAYEGEIAINPADGSILRLTLKAKLKPDGLVTRANMLVEYGPVEIGGVPYICPVRSVAFTLIRKDGVEGYDKAQGPLQAKLNDVTFKQYHRFRSEVRILTGEIPELEEKSGSANVAPAAQKAAQ